MKPALYYLTVLIASPFLLYLTLCLSLCPSLHTHTSLSLSVSLSPPPLSVCLSVCLSLFLNSQFQNAMLKMLMKTVKKTNQQQTILISVFTEQEVILPPATPNSVKQIVGAATIRKLDKRSQPIQASNNSLVCTTWHPLVLCETLTSPCESAFNLCPKLVIDHLPAVPNATA